MQRIDGVAYPLAHAQDAVCPDDGDTIILETTIPALGQGRSLLFYATHQEINVFVDDVCIQTLACPEEMEFYGSVGRLWVDVPISCDMVGKTLRVEISSPFPMYRTVPTTFYFVPPRDIQSVQLDFMWIRNTIALAILALAAVSYVNATLWEQNRMRRYIFNLADLYLFTGLWLCGEINILSVWIGHSTAASLLSMVFVRMIPVVFYYFVRAMLDDNPILVKIAGVLAWGNLVFSVVHQMVLGVSLVAILPVHIAVMGVSCVLYLVEMIRHFAAQKEHNLYDKAYYASAIMLVAALAEISFYFNNQIFGQYNGFAISFACVVYACIAHVLLVKNESNTEVSNRRLEHAHRVMETRPLNQQISAHFLFNTLNTIQAYCKEDPAKADLAVGWLAQYMRGYMYHINNNSYIPFRESISLMQLYLNIQNLRFEEEILLETDISFDAFVLPPLTLQPLVENAVKHGIHGHVKQGVVRISSACVGDMVEVIVSDNGCGFDTSTKSKDSVGLSNLERRIRAMGGDMRVESTIGEGTHVILNVPLNPTV